MLGGTLRAENSAWDSRGRNTFLEEEGFRLRLTVCPWASRFIFLWSFRFPPAKLRDREWSLWGVNHIKECPGGAEACGWFGGGDVGQVCLIHGEVGLGCHLCDSIAIGSGKHLLTEEGGVWGGDMWPEHMCVGFESVKGQGSQITLTLGGRILTVRSEGPLWTVSPRLLLPQEIPRPKPLGSDLKSSPELPCEPGSVLTHFGSQVFHMNSNDDKSICVLVERWMKCFQRSSPGLLCFSSMTLSPF